MIFITSDGVTLHYNLLGEGFPVIFIHGWAATSNFWKYVVPIEGIQSILVDLRGHGQSGKSGDYYPDRIVRDIIELIEYLSLESFSLVGHSLGGVIATLTAEKKLPEKLILIATPPALYMSKLQFTLLKMMLKYANFITRRTITPRTLYKPNKELLNFIWRESAKGSIDAYIAYMKNFNGINILRILPKIDIEKYAVIPSNDMIVPTSVQIKAFKDLCKIILVKGAGHNVMLERPSVLREELKRILIK